MPTRKEILQRLSAGEIDVTEATELLATATDDEEPQAAALPAAGAPAARKSKLGMRWLHIHVSDLESGRHRVRVNVPLGLVNLGLRMGARFTDELDNGTMSEVLDALRDESISGTLVEVEDVDDNERVHIFID